MNYFLVVQDEAGDKDPSFSGPYSNLAKAKEDAVTNWDHEEGRIFTVLVQKRLLFVQVSQAVVVAALSWKE